MIHPAYLPGYREQPWFYPTIPPTPRGRWVWEPDPVPRPQYPCDACRNGGLCGCVRNVH